MKNTTRANGRVSQTKNSFNTKRKFKSFQRNTAYISKFKNRYAAIKGIREVISDILFFCTQIDSKVNGKEEDNV